MKEQLARLERVAGELNAWLLVIAVGLTVLDFTVLVARYMPSLPTLPAGAGAAAAGQLAAQPIPTKTPEAHS
jgi:hypothetical protein